MKNELSDMECVYLSMLFRRIKGIGEHKSAKLICLRDTFSEFGNISIDDLLEINSLNEELVEKIIELVESIDFNRSVEILLQD